MLTRFLSVLTVFLACTLPTQAAWLEPVIEDFAPHDGVVIMPADGDYLIDLDASKGVQVGDLVSVIALGEKIVHPVSGEILGSLDQTGAILEITQLKTGYAHARPATSGPEIARGDTVRRFGNIPTVFRDETGKGHEVFTELQHALPNLEWSAGDAGSAQTESVLSFTLTDDSLTVLGPSGLLHTYPRARADKQPAPVIFPKAQTSPEGGAPARFDISYPGYDIDLNLPGTITSADFLRNGSQFLLASANSHDVAVYDLTSDGRQLARYAIEGTPQILSVAWWTPQGPGQKSPFLAVTIWTGQRLTSALLHLQAGHLTEVQTFMPYALGSFDLDGDRLPELLLGQGFSEQSFFARRVVALHLEGDSLEAGDPPIELPGKFTVTGSTLADVTGDGAPETLLSRYGFLYVFSGEKEIYKSRKQVGGSLSVATWETLPGSEYSQAEHAMIEVAPTAYDLDGDGVREIVVVASDRSSISAPGISPASDAYWLSAVKYRKESFVAGTIGDRINVPIQGLGIHDDRLLFVATKPNSLLKEDGGSTLLSYPLAR